MRDAPLATHLRNLWRRLIAGAALDNIRPDKLIVCGAGIESHQEFVELVLSKLGGIPRSE